MEAVVKKVINDFMERQTNVNVRMFVTWTEGGQSKCYSYGGGEWYAQYGQAREWVLVQEERARHQAIEADRPAGDRPEGAF